MTSDSIQAESLALSILRGLAKKYTAVGLVISDCGCWTVSLWVDGCKITEEDKSLAAAVRLIVERIENAAG